MLVWGLVVLSPYSVAAKVVGDSTAIAAPRRGEPVRRSVSKVAVAAHVLVSLLNAITAKAMLNVDW
jgi:hypothetical protein